MRNHFVLVAGLLLSSSLPVEAQTPAAQIVPAQTAPGLSPILFRVPRVRSSELASRPLPHLAAAYEPEPSLESRLQIDEFRTPLLTESTFPVAHLWRGLELDVFESTLHSQPGSPTLGTGFQYLRPSSNDQAAIASSVGRDGLSLRYSFGRNEGRRKPFQIWRCLSWVIGNGRGCPL